MKTSSMGWVQPVITLLVTGIFSLGVILFFSYNWQVIPKYGKLAIIFSGLLLFHGLGVYVGRGLSKEEKSSHIPSQGFHLLGTLMFAAGVILIAQIYHINEHFPNGIAAMAVGALIMAWMVPSVWQVRLAITCAAVFCHCHHMVNNRYVDFTF